MKKQKRKKSKAQNSAINITDNFIRKVFYFMIYSASIFILLFIPAAIVVIVLEINMNYINIFHSLQIYNTGTNMYITYILNRYIKDRDIGPDNYITTNKKSIKIDLYEISIIAVDTLNDLNIIILADIVYCFIFLINIISAKHFQFKKIYLNKKHSQLHKKKIT